MMCNEFFDEQNKPHGFVSNAAPASAVRPTIYKGVQAKRRDAALPCGNTHGNDVCLRCRRAIVVQRQIKRHDGFTRDQR